MPVVPDSPYCERGPIALGTLHIDIFMKLATQEELEKLVIIGKGMPCPKCNWQIKCH